MAIPDAPSSVLRRAPVRQAQRVGGRGAGVSAPGTQRPCEAWPTPEPGPEAPPPPAWPRDSAWHCSGSLPSFREAPCAQGRAPALSHCWALTADLLGPGSHLRGVFPVCPAAGGRGLAVHNRSRPLQTPLKSQCPRPGVGACSAEDRWAALWAGEPLQGGAALSRGWEGKGQTLLPPSRHLLGLEPRG